MSAEERKRWWRLAATSVVGGGLAVVGWFEFLRPVTAEPIPAPGVSLNENANAEPGHWYRSPNPVSQPPAQNTGEIVRISATEPQYGSRGACDTEQHTDIDRALGRSAFFRLGPGREPVAIAVHSRDSRFWISPTEGSYPVAGNSLNEFAIHRTTNGCREYTNFTGYTVSNAHDGHSLAA
jgi:hypothetical protein